MQRLDRRCWGDAFASFLCEGSVDCYICFRKCTCLTCNIYLLSDGSTRIWWSFFNKQPSLDICTETVGYQILQHVAPAWTPSKPAPNSPSVSLHPFFCLNTPNVIIALLKTTRVIVVLLMHFSITSWHHICLLGTVQVRINTGLMSALTQDFSVTNMACIVADTRWRRNFIIQVSGADLKHSLPKTLASNGHCCYSKSVLMYM